MFKYVSEDLDFAHKFDESPRPAPDYEKHYHDFFELLYFVRGNVDFTVEDRIYRLHPGDIVFIQPGEHHYLTFLQDSDYERYVLKFRENTIPKHMFGRIGNRASFYTVSDEIRELFASMDKLCERFDGNDLELMLSCRMLEIMTLICLEPEADKKAFRDKTIAQIINYVNENMSEPITLTKICDHFHFSQSYISNKFTNHMKVSIISYVRTKKVMAAHRDIVKGDKPTDVANRYGFIDYSTFYRAYTKVMGFPPSSNK